ncbi:hypothetical protein BH23CHL2_BH23CHL2_19640 [soil metagenome]
MTPEGYRPTPEDAASRRDERLQEAFELLEAGVDEIVTSDGFQQYLEMMSRFHRYSYSNVLMIMAQKPDATRLAGYRQWQQLGRQVKRGERGIRILAPYRRRIVEQPGDDEEDEAATYVTRGFGVATIFDVSQTEGEPLPEPPSPQELEGEHAASFWLADRLREHLEEKGVLLQLTELGGPKGTYHPLLRRIQLQVGMSPDQTAKTLCHETAHFAADHTAGVHRRDAETVAEASSYVVLRHYGVDSAEYSFPYIASWTGDRQILTRNLAAVQRVSDSLITSIDERSQYGADLAIFRSQQG